MLEQLNSCESLEYTGYKFSSNEDEKLTNKFLDDRHILLIDKTNGMIISETDIYVADIEEI